MFISSYNIERINYKKGKLPLFDAYRVIKLEIILYLIIECVLVIAYITC